jgi:hypothetical protein
MDCDDAADQSVRVIIDLPVGNSVLDFRIVAWDDFFQDIELRWTRLLLRLSNDAQFPMNVGQGVTNLLTIALAAVRLSASFCIGGSSTQDKRASLLSSDPEDLRACDDLVASCDGRLAISRLFARPVSLPNSMSSDGRSRVTVRLSSFLPT